MASQLFFNQSSPQEGIELASRIPLPLSTSTSLAESESDPVSSRAALEGASHGVAVLHPADGGIHAWSFLAAAFAVEAIVWGFPNAYPVFLDFYLQDPYYASQKSAASLLPLIGTLSSGIIYCSGAFLNPIASRFPQHRRKSMWLGAVMCCGSLLGASYADKIFQLVLLQGVVWAIGGSLLYFTCISYMSEWFIARRGMANGILFAGTAVGGVLLPLVLPRLIGTYGPSKTLRIMTVGIAVLLLPLLPLVKGPSSGNPRPRLGAGAARGAEPTKLDAGQDILAFPGLSTRCKGLAYFVPILYLPTFANDLRISPNNSAVTLSVLNAAAVLGRLLVGFLSDKLNPWVLALTTLLTASAATFILWGALSHSFAGLLVFSIAYGGVASGWTSVYSGFIKPVAKDDPALTTTLFGYLLFSRGLGNILSTPISAKLYTSSRNVTGAIGTGFDVGDGRFETMIIYVGTCFAGAAGIAALGWGMDARKVPRTSRDQSHGSE
ncbi:MFS general substrate transporter [Mycena filopes]|nr:MFS general substrate transporter [Mycena filopes]